LSFGTIEEGKLLANSNIEYLRTQGALEEEAVPTRDGTVTRRSSRVTLRVPMKVYERGKDQRYVVEDAYSLKVSLWGGLITLNSAVNVGQKLVVVNQSTWETKEARVVYLGPLQQEGRLVGFEFLKSSPDFWGIGFPSVASPRPLARSTHN
jgi:hypothetical protein